MRNHDGTWFDSNNAAMRSTWARLDRIARTELDVLLLGETGVGKEVAAREIHARSARASGPFVVIDCASLPATLVEALLFGHEEGIFTNATRARPSPFAQARGGTVFLDEIGELPLDAQGKLLRVLAERSVQPLGARAPIALHVRVISATNRDLGAEVGAGRFRRDLYHRVADQAIELPPLRRRAEDIPALIRAALARLGSESAFERISPSSLARAASYDWPGNVRELHAVVRSALALAAPDEPLEIVAPRVAAGDERTSAPAGDALPTSFEQGKQEAIQRFARAYFTALFARSRGSVSGVAREARMDRKSARRYLVELGLVAERER